VICGTNDSLDLGLEFQFETDGSMSVFVQDGSRFQGHPDRLHEGIISMPFDAAMTRCLFGRDVTGVTGSLNIRFLKPVICDRFATVRTHVKEQKSHLFLLEGTLQQDGELKSTAEAKFWAVSHAPECSK
jgi:acyl-coenzyme A thioesterase PaaI-like protein